MSEQTTFVNDSVRRLARAGSVPAQGGSPLHPGPTGARPVAGSRGAGRARVAIWAARIVKTLLVVFLALDGAVKVLQLGPAVEGTARVGYPTSAVLGIGLAELACTALYLLPRTTVLGAILLTGYLGGATATHVRIGEPFVLPILFGVLVWAAPFASDGRLRALVPFRR